MRIVVKIPHIAWRDARPRFTPGPRLRALGFKGEDLKDERGVWLDLRAASAWAKAKEKSIEAATAAARSKKSEKQRDAVRAQATAVKKRRDDIGAFTVGDMFKEFFAAKKFRDAGKPGGMAKSSKTDYQSKADVIMKADPELWTSPAAALTRGIVKGFHEDLWETRGHAMANGVIAVLRAAFGHAQDNHPWLSNPCLRLKLPPVQARLRVATLDEIAALIKEADASDPEIGDAIVLALFTGQRQGDVLALEERAVEDGKIRFIQSKTGARVRVKALPPLIERLTSARMRRMTQQMRLQAERSNRQVSSTIVVDSRTSETFSPFAFRHRFGALRARAAKETESLADLLFLDLRDTAVTWLANAGCTVPEIAAISGHSLQSVHNILRHYLESNEEQADNAMDKLESWLTAKKWGK